MLVLTRKTGQRLHIGDYVVITVLEARKNKVRSGIDAPEDVAVDREEVWEKKRERDTQSSPFALVPGNPR